MSTQDTTHIHEGWRETTLGEVANFSQGFQVSTDFQSEEKKENFVRFIRIVDYTNENETPRFIEHPGRCFVDEDDLVMIRYGSQTAGKIVRGISGVIANNTFQIVPQIELNKDWLFWYLKQDDIYQYLNKDQSSSTMPAITFSQVSKIKIFLPPLSEQRAIADMLSSLDGKIELLREQNETLEKTAQTIFHEWFGRYSVESSEELPEGWRVGKIEDLTTQMNSGGTPSTKEEKYYNGLINWFSTKELQDNYIFESEKKITDFGLKNSAAKLFPKDTVVMAIYAAPTVGRLGILAKESAFNQAAIGLVAKDEISFPFIYLLLKNLRDELNGLANGAAQQNLNVGLVKNFKIIIPDKEILQKFIIAIYPIFIKIRSNSEQIQSLSKTRDTLLPKLMSGEVRVI